MSVFQTQSSSTVFQARVAFTPTSGLYIHLKHLWKEEQPIVLPAIPQSRNFLVVRSVKLLIEDKIIILRTNSTKKTVIIAEIFLELIEFEAGSGF